MLARTPQVVLTIGLALLVSSCSPEPLKEKLSDLIEEFIYTSLSNSPVTATQVGYHKHGAIELDSQLALAYNIRGTIYHQKQQYEQAVAEYSKAIELSPRKTFFENRAISYRALNNTKLATKDEKEALALAKYREENPIPQNSNPNQASSKTPNAVKSMPKPSPSQIKPIPKPEVKKTPNPRKNPNPNSDCVYTGDC